MLTIITAIIIIIHVNENKTDGARRPPGCVSARAVPSAAADCAGLYERPSQRTRVVVDRTPARLHFAAASTRLYETLSPSHASRPVCPLVDSVHVSVKQRLQSVQNKNQQKQLPDGHILSPCMEP